MAIWDLTQGFWFALGFTPIVCLVWAAGKYFEYSVWGSYQRHEYKEREAEAYKRGLDEGRREHILDRAIETINERMSEKSNQ